ncbi:MAG: L-threonylcarbamoyladenylate synthase [Candidatus Tokpelaia sp. JSC188]|nr:MAG: L-threonylcarbamoyladenylate synthase [Candidatus Tokpelaia sp. JSC188]
MGIILSAVKENIVLAVNYLKQGVLVALPTETVYGLGADATNGVAVAEIFTVKGRPQFNPLIAHVSNIAMAKRYVDIDPLSQKLMDHFWPGPLTFVLPLREKSEIHPLVTAGLTSLAIRSPQGIFSEIIELLDVPVATPSANRSGRISPTTAAAVAEDIGGEVELILDGGSCSIGVESTIIKVVENGILLLRPGGTSCAEIEKITDLPVLRYNQCTAIEAPGMLDSHYAPDIAVRLNAEEAYEGEALLAFGPRRAKGSKKAMAILNLSPLGDIKEAAIHLFDYLRRLNRQGVSCIAVEPVPMEGLGEAINDRLTRAAALRTKDY